MIRSIWAYAFAAAATLFYGSVAMAAALLRFRGGIYFWATQQWGRALLKGSACAVRVHGLERVDWSRPAVLVSNHVGAFDILALAATVPVRYHFVAKKELERIPVFGRAWKAAGHISIDRQNRQSAIASLQRAGEVIRSEGGIIIVFPEGTRSRTGELQPFKKGAFLLAMEAAVPVIPAVVVGSERIMPSGTRMVRPGVMDLHLGAPIHPRRVSSVDELIETVHETMSEMLTSGRKAMPVE